MWYMRVEIMIDRNHFSFFLGIKSCQTCLTVSWLTSDVNSALIRTVLVV
jgi:hypothetical protein